MIPLPNEDVTPPVTKMNFAMYDYIIEWDLIKYSWYPKKGFNINATKFYCMPKKKSTWRKDTGENSRGSCKHTPIYPAVKNCRKSVEKKETSGKHNLCSISTEMQKIHHIDFQFDMKFKAILEERISLSGGYSIHTIEITVFHTVNLFDF